MKRVIGNPLKSSSALRTRAQQVIEELGLYQITHDLGDLQFTGSYELDLMVWRDIDCQILIPEAQVPEQVFIQLISKLFQTKGISNIKLINFTLNPKPHMPSGLFCGIEFMPEDKEKWKIDIWHLSKKDFMSNRQFMSSLKSCLTPELKVLILKWKYRLLTNQGRLPHLASYMLYQAILLKGLIEDNDVLAYLKNNGVTID